jgi:hypothetical protein
LGPLTPFFRSGSDLDCNVAIQSRIAGAIDLAHPKPRDEVQTNETRTIFVKWQDSMEDRLKAARLRVANREEAE